jgi:hypothetical protein
MASGLLTGDQLVVSARADDDGGEESPSSREKTLVQYDSSFVTLMSFRL